MNQIKVAFFIDSYRPGAGTENQLRGILKHLDPNKFTAVLFTLDSEVPSEHRSNLPWPIKCLHVQKLLSIRGLWRFTYLVRYLRRKPFDIAVIFFHYSNAYIVPACYLARIKVCIVSRRDMGYWYTRRWLRLLRVINKCTDYFLVNAEAIRKQVSEVEKFPYERIKVIPNALWDGESDSDGAPLNAFIDLANRCRIVGLVANLRPVKRIDRFIAMARIVARHLPDVHFVILGHGYLLDALKGLATAEGLADRIHFLGSVPNVRKYVPHFTIGVLTSESEGLSNALIEYGAAGVPIVAFDVGGNREIVSPGENGILIPDGDIQGMADAVVHILYDPALWQRLSAAGPGKVRHTFSPQVVTGKIEDFLLASVSAPKRALRFN